MTPTYEALELAASHLIDAVDDYTMSGTDDASAAGRRLILAVGDTCSALGSPTAAYRARRVADEFEGAIHMYRVRGVDECSPTIEKLETNFRGVVLPWFDGVDPGDLDLESAARVLREASTGFNDADGRERFEPIGGEHPEIPAENELSQASAVAERIAEIVEAAASDTGDGSSAVAVAIEDAHAAGAGVIGILSAVAGALDLDGHANAAEILRGE